MASMLSINGAESLHHGAWTVGPVHRGNENDVSLVALNVFQVLDKEWFECLFPFLAVLICGRIFGDQPIDLQCKELALRAVERHHPKGQGRMFPHELYCGGS